jgi:hypothetical protein
MPKYVIDNDPIAKYTVFQFISWGYTVTTKRQPIYKQVAFHPPEADRIAEDIHRLLLTLTSEYHQLDTASTNVCYGWLGHQSDKFFSQTRPKVRKLADFVEFLRTREKFYREINVTKWVEVEQP